MALVTVCTATMGICMADTIAATLAIPLMDPLVAQSHARGIDLQWVVTCFAVPFAALLAVAGRLADLIGRRLLLAIGLAMFGCGAVGCMLAPDLPVLLAARALQGVGAAAMVPVSLGLLLAEISAQRRAAAIGAWNAAGGFGGLIVHAAGGWLAGTAGWRMLYLPTAAAAALLLALCLLLPRSAAGRRGPLPDLLGAALLLIGIAAIVTAISTGLMWHWSLPPIAALGCGGGGAVAATVWRSIQHRVPVIEISLWRSPTFRAAGGVSALHGLITFPLLVIAPRFLHGLWSYPPALVGLAMVPLSTGVLVASAIAARLSKRHGPPPVIYAGAIATAAAGIWLIGTALRIDQAVPQVWLPATGLLGLGLGTLVTGATIAGTLSATPGHFAAAVGTAMTARQIGGALGVAAAGALIGQPLASFGPAGGYIMVIGVGIAAALLSGLLALFMPAGAHPAPQAPPVRSAGPAASGLDAEQPLPRAALLTLYAAAESLVKTADALLASQRCICHPPARPPSAGTEHQRIDAMVS
jgi:MFS family permease